MTCSSTSRSAVRTATHSDTNGSSPPCSGSSWGRIPRTDASGPSSTRMTSATVISPAGRARFQPPSGPRLLRSTPPVRSARRMSWRKPGGMASSLATASRLTGSPGCSRSWRAIATTARTP